jgi:SAM-dependent methyltransferase
LLQAWYARAKPGVLPYRFYALSNAGSMLALLSYPVLVEPFVAGTHQAIGWSVAFGLVALFGVGLAVLVVRRSEGGASPMLAGAEIAKAGPSAATKILWVALAACGSALLLAVTNHISQNIASVPFLWIIPLSLYLLSFIFCFDTTAWYQRDFFLRLLAVALGAMAYALEPSFAVLPMKVLIPVYCAGLWICCMFCHGELARLKPDSQHLTSFYLLIALGGALGAVFVALLAPVIFSGYYELPCALGACAVLVLAAQLRDPSRPFQRNRWAPARFILGGLVMALLTSLFVGVRETKKAATLSVRNFYGVLQVTDYSGAEQSDSPRGQSSGQTSTSRSGTFEARQMHTPTYLSPYQTSYRRLVNGTISHGLQFLSPGLRDRPTSYYGEKSGIGVALRAIQKRGALRVGIVGLGAGTIAAYGRTGDRYTFYEINPLDVQIAEQEFSFLSDSKANVNIVPGDARLSLESEPAQNYDALAIDAFSSDSIPVHLLTREAFALYFRQLKPDGVLALHISNQYLNLQPVVEAAAVDAGKEAILVNNDDNQREGIYAASWILLGNPGGFYGKREMEAAGAILLPLGRQRLWTDNYSSVLKVLK